MATSYPESFPLDLSDEGSRRGEKLVFNAFRSKLPANVNIYYSRNWRGLRHFRQSSFQYVRGEADFIIVWPEYGIIFVECKGGSVEVRDNKYYSRSRMGNVYPIKDPHEQAKRSMYRVIDHIDIKRIIPRPRWELEQIFTYAAFFPESVRRTWAAKSINNELSFSAFDTDLLDPSAWIISCFVRPMAERDLDPLSRNEVSAFHECLSPSGSFPLSSASQLIETEQFFDSGITPTSEQSHVINQLIRNHNVLLFGSAGTGKTLVGLEVMRLLSAKSNNRSAFICHSSLLSARLKSNYSSLLPRVDFVSSHELPIYLEKIAKTLSLNADGLSSPSDLVNLISQNSGFRLSHIVIDEMQDLDDSLILSLRRLTSQKGIFLGLYDISQALGLGDFSPSEIRTLFEFDNYLSLTSNLRNTPQIMERVIGLCATVDIATCIAPDGPDVINRERYNDSPEELFELVDTLCRTYSLHSSQIVVLLKSLADLDAEKYRFQVNADGSIALCLLKSASRLNVELNSIADFKGLESLCVILWTSPDSLGEN
ncbi:AAA family ATPase [Vulcanococcus sp.]|jgi:hypothetical protein|uniref:nuclease-related domain-containing DEAD/DEAH box helicase n=1 Tax=Vulcanococcus sp. TaxID=2856995 RepID=UPI0037D997D2